MKKSYLILGLMLAVGLNVQTFAQTNPGTANLKHQWTFDDGVVDVVGGLTATLEGAATVTNKALNTTGGGYASLPAAEIGINAYPGITTELWFTAPAGVNTGFSALSYFGNTSGNIGVDYFLNQPARQDNVGRAALSCLNASDPWATESGTNGPEYDDGLVHHWVTTVSETDITLYIDGAMISTAPLSENNKIANLSTAKALLAHGGYTGDPTWRGNIHKFSLYNRVLTADEILYMYQDGAEDQEVMTATVSAVALDTYTPAAMFNFSSANLGNNITVTAPAGITVDPATIAKNVNDVPLAIIWDATTPVNGNVVFKSGNTELSIAVKTADDSECYKPLYETVENIVTDPGMNMMSSFAGWGSKTLINIITDSADVYCGATTAKVGNGTNSGSGSIDYILTGALEPSTTYRLVANVKTMGGSFQIGVAGHDAARASNDENFVFDTNGEWSVLDTTFTTGATLRETQLMFFNNSSCTGLTGFIDNWQVYVMPDPTITVNLKEVALDPEYKTIELIVSGGNLSAPITVTAPAGVTLSTSSFALNDENKVMADTTIITWNGTTAISDMIQVASSGMTISVPVKTTLNSNTACFTPLFTDRQNLVPDPYMNNPAKFGGWGAKGFISIISQPDSVRCGSHTGIIDGGGSMDVILTGIMQPAKSYIVRAQIKTIGGSFQLGVWGMDAFFNGDLQDTIDTHGEWSTIQLEFASADSLKATGQGMFINNYQRSGTKCFIDNWEMYEIGTGVNNTSLLSGNKVFINDNRIVADFTLASASAVEINVYNMQGALVSTEKLMGNAGSNLRTLNADLNAGVYIVKINSEGKQFVGRVIK